MPRLKKKSVDQIRRDRAKTSAEYYERNKAELREISRTRLANKRKNDPDARQRERQRDALAKAKRRSNEHFKARERQRNTRARAIARKGPEYAEWLDANADEKYEEKQHERSSRTIAERKRRIQNLKQQEFERVRQKEIEEHVKEKKRKQDARERDNRLLVRQRQGCVNSTQMLAMLRSKNSQIKKIEEKCMNATEELDVQLVPLKS